MQLKPNVTPVGGWLFVDAPINAEPMQDWDVNTLIQNVANRRSQNPRFNLTTNPDAIREEIKSQNVSRMNALLKTPAERSAYLLDDGQPVSPPSFPQPHPVSAPGVGRAVNSGIVSRAKVGIAVLSDWLGAGMKPVDSSLSESRAKVCVACPLNSLGDFWTRIAASAASKIKAGVNIKNSMKLTTAQDENLHSCQACSCWLPLKVHVPIQHIVEHDNEEIRKNLHPSCWIISESK